MRLTSGIKRGDMFPCPFIDPAVRMSEMHYSGIIELAETPITPGLEKNEAGRIAHVKSGLATHLYDVDDSGWV